MILQMSVRISSVNAGFHAACASQIAFGIEVVGSFGTGTDQARAHRQACVVSLRQPGAQSWRFRPRHRDPQAIGGSANFTLFLVAAIGFAIGSKATALIEMKQHPAKFLS